MPPRSAPLPGLHATFWAWLAGYVEGDGCIGIYGVASGKNRRSYMTPRITIAQKDPQALEHIRSRLRTGSLGRRGKTSTGDVMWHLVFGPGATRQICRRILPYLVADEKRDRCQKVLDHPRYASWGILKKEAS